MKNRVPAPHPHALSFQTGSTPSSPWQKLHLRIDDREASSLGSLPQVLRATGTLRKPEALS